MKNENLKSNFSIQPLEKGSYDGDVLLIDLGPWDKFKTITNDAENIIKYLYERGLCIGQKVFYIDSDGEMGELLHQNGVFTGFKYVYNNKSK